MTTIKIRAGSMKQIRTSPEVVAELTKRAHAIRDGAAADAGIDGYEVKPLERRKNRAAVGVMVVGQHASRVERKYHHIMRNLDRGR